jgi:hypothetical protein
MDIQTTSTDYSISEENNMMLWLLPRNVVAPASGTAEDDDHAGTFRQNTVPHDVLSTGVSASTKEVPLTIGGGAALHYFVWVSFFLSSMLHY